jgi:nitrile hydratase
VTDGIHDMGGMHGLGELGYEREEPVFHAPWEGRVHALVTALTRHGRWRSLRPEIELIPAKQYLAMSYYERWLAALTALIVKSGLATEQEIERGKPQAGSERFVPAITAATARATLLLTPRTELAAHVEPRYVVGQRVRGANLHTAAHTRMPRYTRGRIGVVERDRGVFPLPEREVYFLDPKPQHVYLVRFTARELWGETASARDSSYIDMWEDHLEPA